MLIKKTILLFALFVFCTNLQAQEQAFYAQNCGEGIHNSYIKKDSKGFLYFAGHYSKKITFKPDKTKAGIVLSDSASTYIVKTDTALNIIWAKVFGNVRNSSVIDFHIDKLDNLYIAGNFIGIADFDPDKSKVKNIGVAVDYTAIAKFDSDGKLIWAFSIGTTNQSPGDNEGASRIITDDSLNVYVCALAFGDIDPGAGVVNVSGCFLVKYNSAGAYKWHKYLQSGQFTSIATSGTKVIAAGKFQRLFILEPAGINIRYTIDQFLTNGFITEFTNNGTFVKSKHIAGGKYIQVDDILIKGTSMYMMIESQDSIYLDFVNKKVGVDKGDGIYLALYNLSDYSYLNKYYQFKAQNPSLFDSKRVVYVPEKNRLLVSLTFSSYVLDLTNLNLLSILSTYQKNVTDDMDDNFSIIYGNTMLSAGYYTGSLYMLGGPFPSPPPLLTSANYTMYLLKTKYYEKSASIYPVQPNELIRYWIKDKNISINMGDKTEIETIKIYDMYGRMVGVKNFSGTEALPYTYSIESITNGYYVMCLYLKNSNYTIRKIIFVN